LERKVDRNRGEIEGMVESRLGEYGE